MASHDEGRSYLLEAIQRAMDKSELAGGVYFASLQSFAQVTIRTVNSVYALVFVDPEKGAAIIQGTGDHFREPTRVRINGSTWGHAMLKMKFIGIGMRLEIWDPSTRRPTTTSSIEAIRVEDYDPAKAQAIAKRV